MTVETKLALVAECAAKLEVVEREMKELGDQYSGQALSAWPALVQARHNELFERMQVLMSQCA